LKIIVPEKNKIIDPLPPIDHTLIEYENFEKNFYDEHEEIKNLSQSEVDELRKTLGIKVNFHLDNNLKIKKNVFLRSQDHQVSLILEIF
jgi:hypothetical protein